MIKLPTPIGSLNVVDNGTAGPATVLLHGFPDDSHIYDRLIPLLDDRRVVAFDFLGYGGSDRVDQATPVDHRRDLAALLDELDLQDVTLVGHDASGPVAIEYALAHTGRVRALVLLNTYYGHALSLRLPEMIRLFADPTLTPLADAMTADAGQLLWLLQHTARGFGAPDELAPDGIEAVSILPQFFGDATNPSALVAVRAWTATLFDDLVRQDGRLGASELARLTTPVTIAFGAEDAYLGPDLAEHLGTMFANARIRTIPNAGHWPQWDKPHEVAKVIRDS